MSKLRLLAALLAVALLGGCGHGNAPADAKKEGGTPHKVLGAGNPDEPIVVSDELHVRHAHYNDNIPDFQIGSNGVFAYSDDGKAIYKLRCKNMTVVSSTSGYPDCTGMGFVVGKHGWQLDIYASNPASAGVSPLITLTPASSSQVLIQPNVGVVLYGAQDAGKDPETKGGTDMAIYSSGILQNLAYAKLTDTTVSPQTSATMSCTDPCEIRIRYDNN